MENTRKRVFTRLCISLLILVIGYTLLRPFHLRWGASGEDVATLAWSKK